MTDDLQVTIQEADGRQEPIRLEIVSTIPGKLFVTGGGFARQEFHGLDLFDAVIALRRTLESRHVKLLCAGARTDVFPSGMTRSMGGGRKAYLMQLGKPAGAQSMVDIFDYAESSRIGSVDEQAEFRRKWAESLKLLSV